MRTIGSVLLALVLLAVLFGGLAGTSARMANAAPMTQQGTSTPASARAPLTATPSAALSVARNLRVTPSPLTTTTVLTATVLTTTALMPVQIVTASTFLTSTLITIPAGGAMPRATPSLTSNGIIEFRAAPARLRGRVDLSWGYQGDAFDGIFLVERSTNGGVWRFVKECIQPYDEEVTAYTCSDTDLTSGTAYTYRACLVDSGTVCASTNATEPVTVKPL